MLPKDTKTGIALSETTTLKTTQTRKEKWDARYLKMALDLCAWSKDRSTQVGCVIVGNAGEILSTGYNGPPRGVDDDVAARHERPEKYHWFEHGERNAIFNAARNGTALAGSTLYVTSTPSKFTCCTDCARAIIQSGIVRVVQEPLQHDSEAQQRWAESTDRVLTMFKEAGVEYNNVSID
jgi:dCMP deaminase